MPVYLAAPGNATLSCVSPGCWCRDRRPVYPSDLTDAQWAVLEPRARQVMRELTVAVGRPMAHDLRAMCDAVAYVVKNGIEWRALPVDFPPWEAVYAFWKRWNNRGLPQELIRRLRELLRAHQGRNAQPSACIVDSQIVKAHDTVPRKTSGYHGGKKITGRGRAPGRGLRGLAAGPGGHRRLGQRQGRGETLADQALRQRLARCGSCGPTAGTTARRCPATPRP